MPDLSHVILGNSLASWLIAAAVASGALAALFLVRRAAAAAVSKIAKKTGLTWNHLAAGLVPKTHGFFLLALAILAASRFLDLGARTEAALSNGFVVVALIQGGLWGVHAITFATAEYRRIKIKRDPAAVTTVGTLAVIARILVWVIIALLIMANAGVEIAPLLAGLGVGGIAIALAVQTVLKDLLASLSILFDKPFVVGDFLIIGDLLGSVEHIGLKTTRIRSLSGEQLVFSNNDLLESRIRNFGRMRERRVDFEIGVTYQTPRKKIARIPAIIREAIEFCDNTRFDRSHFKEFGDFSLVFETVYFIAVPDFNTYMDIQQAINLRIHEAFETEGIEFAFPTQTLFVARQQAAGIQPVQQTPVPAE